MYNLPPPYSTRNNYSKSKNFYNNKIYNKTGAIIKDSVESTKKSKVDESLDELSRNNSYNDDILFEIFGLKIYFDDVLILCILLFLYQEGIQDEYLFIALILLLLS